VAAHTTRIRVGAGGIMLPNHTPLRVVEIFRTLEALHPGRIDLGLGRAPGTDPVTSYALRRRQDDPNADDFLERFQELLLFEQRGFPESHPFRKVNAMPADVPLPPIFLLGSSGYSAQLAAHVGAGFSFAHHFSDFDPVGPMTTYREQFKPSEQRPVPHAILALHVVCADTNAEAERLATSIDLNFALRRQGRYQPIPSPEEAAAHSYSPTDRALIGQNRARLVVGDKTKVMAHLEPLLVATKADEVMITTMIYDHEARKHSYALMAEAFGISPSR